MFEHEASSAIWGLSPTMFLVGAVAHVISIAFPHWLASRYAHMGLWSYCTVVYVQEEWANSQCVGITDALNTADHSWLRTVQGLEIAATVFVLTAVVTGLMRINLGNNIWQVASGLSSCIAGVLSISGAVVLAKNYTSIPELVLSWAFVFNAVSGPLCLLAGPILILDVLCHSS